MIGIYAQFHKHFPYNENSNWFYPCYVDDIDLGKNSIRIDWIFDDIYKYYEREGVSKKDFLKAFGQQSTEYWLLKNTPDLEYIGSATYRRLLNFNLPITLGKNRIEGSEITGVRANVEEAHKANTNEEGEIAKHYLQFVDVITNHSSYLPGSIEEQYLQTQPKEYWNLFKKAILELFPEYEESYKWLWQSKTNFNTVYIFRKELFLKYASELFQILEYIYQNCSKVYPTKQPGDQFSEPFPWRYPGFIGERFLPFFINANSLRKMEVPLVHFY